MRRITWLLTLLLAAGVPLKVVSETLGHSSIAITADVYAHVTPDLRREAAEAQERAHRARSERERAQELEEQARDVDPDTDGRAEEDAQTRQNGAEVRTRT